MNINELLIPVEFIPLFSKLTSGKVVDCENNKNSFYRVCESDIVEVMLALGAVLKTDISGEEYNNESVHLLKSYFDEDVDYQDNKDDLLKQLIEIQINESCNLIRALSLSQNRSLKNLAQRYGGKSAASNLANFMAKSNEELRLMRRATKSKVATLFDLEESEFSRLLESSIDVLGKFDME